MLKQITFNDSFQEYISSQVNNLPIEGRNEPRSHGFSRPGLGDGRIGSGFGQGGNRTVRPARAEDLVLADQLAKVGRRRFCRFFVSRFDAVDVLVLFDVFGFRLETRNKQDVGYFLFRIFIGLVVISNSMCSVKTITRGKMISVSLNSEAEGIVSRWISQLAQHVFLGETRRFEPKSKPLVP